MMRDIPCRALRFSASSHETWVLNRPKRFEKQGPAARAGRSACIKRADCTRLWRLEAISLEHFSVRLPLARARSDTGQAAENALGYRLASSTKRCFCLYGTMADVYRTALVPHTTEQMFDLVNDVAEYPDFLPWCGGVEIFRQDECHLEARVNIHFKGIRQ